MDAYLGRVPNHTSVKARLSLQSITILREVPQWLSGRFYDVGLCLPKCVKHTHEACGHRAWTCTVSASGCWSAGGHQCPAFTSSAQWGQRSSGPPPMEFPQRTLGGPLFGYLLGSSLSVPPSHIQLLATVNKSVIRQTQPKPTVGVRLSGGKRSVSAHMCSLASRVYNKKDKGPGVPSRSSSRSPLVAQWVGDPTLSLLP